MSNFRRDDAWQREQRDRILKPGFYDRFATDGRYVFVDKGRFATMLQRRFAVDTVVQGRQGRAIAVEEKIVRWPGYAYTCFCLETDSCTVPGRESDGWMRYGQSDYLLYCFQQLNFDLLCHLVEFGPLKAWFADHEREFHTFGPLDTLNRSAGRKVPVSAVAKAVKTLRCLVPCPPDFREEQKSPS